MLFGYDVSYFSIKTTVSVTIPMSYSLQMSKEKADLQHSKGPLLILAVIVSKEGLEMEDLLGSIEVIFFL